MKTLIKCILVVYAALLISVHGLPQLLFANRKDIRLIDVSKIRRNSTVVIGHLDDAATVDFYYQDQIVFWADISLEMIKKAYINNASTVENVITTGIISPEGLACDWITKKLYWIDAETNRIEISNFDGSYRKVLIWQNIDQPRSVTLSPMDGLMFWTDWGEVPRIERASMDGNNLSRTVIVKENVSWPNGVTIDYEAKRIYWADAKIHEISSVDFNGENRRLVVDQLGEPYALTIYKNIIYWTDWQTRSIYMFNQTSGVRRLFLKQNSAVTLSPMGIHGFAADRQPNKTTPCHNNNGGCSHLCLLSSTPPYYSCACPTGVKLKSTTTCYDDVQEMLLLARRTDIRRISLDTPDYTDVVLPIEGLKHAIAIDFDPVEKYIYWSDDEVKKIKRSLLNGSNQEDLVVAEVDHPDGLAVDWIARNLYWTDTGTDRIEVIRLNGTSRKILINQDLVEPRAIVLDPVRGLMFWSDWGERPKIERAAMDGSDRKAIISSDLGWPNGLAIDYQFSKIYWADAKTDKIELCNYNGESRRELVTEEIPHIFGIGLLGDFLYWDDWQQRSIGRVNKVLGTQREIIIEHLADLMGLKAACSNGELGTNLCAENNGGCSHLCLNRPNNNYVCSCPMWMELTADAKTCVVPEAFLLFAHRTDIRRVSLETHHNNVVIPLSGIKDAIALDFDINDNRIYWIDVGLKSIRRAFMNGSNLEYVVDFGLEYPEGIALDWVARNIYWTDMGSKRIEVARLDGSSRKVLVWENIESPHTLTLDPSSGVMYWSDWGESRHIENAALDGSMRSVFMKDVGRAAGLTLDYDERKIYWVNIDSKIIEYADFNGDGRKLILAQSLLGPYALTQYRDYIYWTDLEAKSIEKANKTNGQNRVKIESSVESVMDILVFHASRQSGWNQCSSQNGGCSHLCLALPLGPGQLVVNYTCSCPTHYTLLPENNTCEAPNHFMLASQKNQVVRLVVDSQDAPDVILPMANLKQIRSIDYDFIERQLYWIDGKSNLIRRINENGTGMSIVVPNPSSNFTPFDIAVDVYSRQIFWSCEKNNVINVNRMDFTSIGVIIGGSNQGDKPRAIALHPIKGLLFWVNMLNEPRIERSAMDGSQRLTLFYDNLKKPNALTVDELHDHIFWADEERKEIVSSNIEGGNRKVHFYNPQLQPIALTVFGNYIFWIDRDNTINKLNWKNDSQGERVLGRFNQLTDIVSVRIPPEKEILGHPCYKNNAKCSHLCFVDGKNQTKCSCPVHLVLKDETTCGDLRTCDVEQFACENNIDCIPKLWYCDGAPDCRDGSDEKNCPTCGKNQFRCQSKECIDAKFECDKVIHCADKSDEERCCGSDEFRCTSNYECIRSDYVCDHKQDCPDGSDEKLPVCSFTSASESESKKTSYTIGIIVAVMIVVAIIAVVYVYRRRINIANANDERRDGMLLYEPPNSANNAGGAVSTVAPENIGNRDSAAMAWKNTRGMGDGSSSDAVAGGIHGRVLLINSGGNSFNKLYNRPHVTGTSSSSSGTTRYPQETLNPPPSPVTERSQYSTYHTPSTSGNHHQSYRHYRSHNRPPPPTPCSTDVCDDSEPYAYRNCQSEYEDELYHPYDDDLCLYPPPPTPRSHYLSDDTYPSCPPSPSTERSYRNPFPPPPSPEGPPDF